MSPNSTELHCCVATEYSIYIFILTRLLITQHLRFPPKRGFGEGVELFEWRHSETTQCTSCVKSYIVLGSRSVRSGIKSRQLSFTIKVWVCEVYLKHFRHPTYNARFVLVKANASARQQNARTDTRKAWRISANITSTKCTHSSLFLHRWRRIKPFPYLNAFLAKRSFV